MTGLEINPLTCVVLRFVMCKMEIIIAFLRSYTQATYPRSRAGTCWALGCARVPALSGEGTDLMPQGGPAYYRQSCDRREEGRDFSRELLLFA